MCWERKRKGREFLRSGSCLFFRSEVDFYRCGWEARTGRVEEEIYVVLWEADWKTMSCLIPVHKTKGKAQKNLLNSIHVLRTGNVCAASKDPLRMVTLRRFLHPIRPAAELFVSVERERAVVASLAMFWYIHEEQSIFLDTKQDESKKSTCISYQIRSPTLILTPSKKKSFKRPPQRTARKPELCLGSHGFDQSSPTAH